MCVGVCMVSVRERERESVCVCVSTRMHSCMYARWVYVCVSFYSVRDTEPARGIPTVQVRESVYESLCIF